MDFRPLDPHIIGMARVAAHDMGSLEIIVAELRGPER
jgi:hypothetical protein